MPRRGTQPSGSLWHDEDAGRRPEKGYAALSTRNIVIFGAGSIGRGLMGQLAASSGFEVLFVEPCEPLRQALAAQGAYHVRLTGRRPGSRVVRGFDVIAPDESEVLAERIACASFAATAVGGPHLESVARPLAGALAHRGTPLPLLLCENWPNADAEMNRWLSERGVSEAKYTCVPCSVERMVRAADGLDLIGESCETLFVDASKWPGPRPPIDDMHFVDALQPYYKRKLYTNNGGHALLAYRGALTRCDLLSQAMDDSRILADLREFLSVACEALHLEYGLDRALLAEHADVLLKYRFPNPELADTVKRVARQPLRKLGPEERLVGLLRVVEAHGLDIGPVCRVMGAALHYHDKDDIECVRMRQMMDAGGPGKVLLEVCGIHSGERAYPHVLDAYEAFRTAPF